MTSAPSPSRTSPRIVPLLRIVSAIGADAVASAMWIVTSASIVPLLTISLPPPAGAASSPKNRPTLAWVEARLVVTRIVPLLAKLVPVALSQWTPSANIPPATMIVPRLSNGLDVRPNRPTALNGLVTVTPPWFRNDATPALHTP